MDIRQCTSSQSENIHFYTITIIGVKKSNSNMPHVTVEAANKNDVDLLKKCLAGEFGVVDAEDLNEALIRSANNGHATCVCLLLAQGVDPDTPDPDEDTPLMLATCNNRTEVVHILLKAGSDVNEISHSGRTALHMAGWNGYGHLVKKLLVAGTDPCIKDKNGQTVIMLAAINGHYDVVKILLDAGSEVNVTCADGNTALHCAARNGHASVMRILLQAGADKNGKNAWGYSPLMLAVEWNQLHVIHTLLAERVNINIQGGIDNQTALHIAAKKGFTRCVELLLAHDAIPDLKDVRCFSPVIVAVSKKQTSIVSLLVKAGADIDTPHLLAVLCLQRCCQLDMYKILVSASCRQDFANKLFKELELMQNMGKQVDQSACAWIKEYIRFPESLQQICRREMRKILRGRMHCSFALQLPFHMKTYLNTYDV